MKLPIESMKIYNYNDFPKITVIGGGTGLSTMLRGLKSQNVNITAIVTVSDDGGGSGDLRENLGILPPGDIRNCILALSNAEPIMYELLNYRFENGNLKGQSFGNLFLAAMDGISESFPIAVKRMCEVLSVKGKVLPVTEENIHLKGIFSDGSSVVGECSITQVKKENNLDIDRIKLVPENPKAYSKAIDAIYNCDMVVLGPGSLYTSIIPNLLVDGISDALVNTNAKVIYVCNVMTQQGETENYKVSDHINAIHKHSSKKVIDICLVNDRKVNKNILKRYSKEDAIPVEIDEDEINKLGVKLIKADFLSSNKDLVRHNGEKLAAKIMELLYKVIK